MPKSKTLSKNTEQSTVKKTRSKSVKPLEIKHKCDFCSREFSNDKTLIAHICEKKRRWLWKDEKYATMGFRAYQMFYKVGMKYKKDKSQEDFIDSQFYTAFIKYGKYLVDINALDPMGFTEFLIRTNVKLDDWCLPRPYEIWIRELGKKEHPFKALERNILLMEQWAKETDNDWTDFFRNVSTPLATKWIKSGRISPWLLFTVGGDLLERLSEEQLTMVRELLDTIYWGVKIREFEEEVESIKVHLRSVGV